MQRFCDSIESMGVINTVKWTIGELINTLAQERGLNLHKLATLSGVSYNTLYSIVRRKSDRVDRQIIEKVSKALNILPSELMPFDDDELFNSKVRAEDGSFSIEIGDASPNNEHIEATVSIDLSAVDLNLISELYAFMKDRGFPEDSLQKMATTIEAAKVEQNQQQDNRTDTEV